MSGSPTSSTTEMDFDAYAGHYDEEIVPVQVTVNGEVRIKLFKGSINVVGRKSASNSPRALNKPGNSGT